MVDLNGKVAIVTGAGTGIGEAIALRFARDGARVVVCGLEDDPVDKVAETIESQGGQAAYFRGDLSHEHQAQACVKECLMRFDRLDCLVNNAGVFLWTGETDQYPSDKFAETIRNNIFSVFFMTREALPHLRKTRGNIISAGSESGLIGLANNTVYGGTKGWVQSFMEGVAVEQGKYGVRANCVCPGPVDTAWTHADQGPMTEKMEEMVTAATVFGRRGTVEEIANVYAFLASDEASFVTGALWTVDGGTTILKGAAGEQAQEEVKQMPPLTLPLQHTHEGLQHKDYGNA